MELIIFLSIVGLFATCIGIWGIIKLYSENKALH